MKEQKKGKSKSKFFEIFAFTPTFNSFEFFEFLHQIDSNLERLRKDDEDAQNELELSQEMDRLLTQGRVWEAERLMKSKKYKRLLNRYT